MTDAIGYDAAVLLATTRNESCGYEVAAMVTGEGVAKDKALAWLVPSGLFCILREGCGKRRTRLAGSSSKERSEPSSPIA